jgi:hypothetical protein
VYDEGAGKECSEAVQVVVEDDTPFLSAADDSYETGFQMPVAGNVLSNDGGLGILMTSVSMEEGGIVTFNGNGNFTFTPDAGFSGSASFVYAVTDLCGNTTSALVTIIVSQGACDFQVEFLNENATCGLSDGIAAAVVSPPSTYFYEWSNGDVGATIHDIPGGAYSVTIEDVNLGCTLVFETVVEQDPAEYISDIEITQPSGTSQGEIAFTLSSPSGGPFEVVVTYPEGIFPFPAEEGEVRLSDFLDLIPGAYHIQVTDVHAGADCIDAFDAVLEEMTMQLLIGMTQMHVNTIRMTNEPTAVKFRDYADVLTGVSLQLRTSLFGIEQESCIDIYQAGQETGIRISQMKPWFGKSDNQIKLQALSGLQLDKYGHRNPEGSLVLQGNVSKSVSRVMQAFASVRCNISLTDFGVFRGGLEAGFRMHVR